MYITIFKKVYEILYSRRKDVKFSNALVMRFVELLSCGLKTYRDHYHCIPTLIHLEDKDQILMLITSSQPTQKYE